MVTENEKVEIQNIMQTIADCIVNSVNSNNEVEELEEENNESE